MNLNIAAMPNLEEDDQSTNFAQKDFRQDFLYSMVKFGILDVETPSKILGMQIEQIPGLMEVKDIVEEAGDVMDEDGAVERIVARLGSLDGNQSIIVTAIVEVHLPTLLWTFVGGIDLGYS